MSLEGTLQRIKSAKFGSAVTDGYKRVYLKVAGSPKSWTVLTPQQLIQTIRTALDVNGIGYESIRNNNAIPLPNLFYNEFTVVIISPNDQSAEVVANLVRQSLDSSFNELVVSILPNENANDWSLNNILGDDPTGIKQVAGVSIGTVALIGVGLLAIVLITKSNPVSFVRSYRR